MCSLALTKHWPQIASSQNRGLVFFWWVFPGKEIFRNLRCLCTVFLQDEAFALWETHWGNIYPANSPSRKLIETFSNTYFLVNLVDNDYVQGNCLFEVVYDVLQRIGKERGPSSLDSMEGEPLGPSRVQGSRQAS